MSDGRSRCPECGARVRRTGLARRALALLGHPTVETGKCGNGHRLRRVRGTVIGPWELERPD